MRDVVLKNLLKGLRILSQLVQPHSFSVPKLRPVNWKKPMSQSKEPDSTEALIGLELNLTTPRIETERTSNVSSEAATEQSVSSRFPILVPPQECALESEPFVTPQQTQERHISFQEEEEGVGDQSSTEGVTADLKVNKDK